MKSIKMKPIYLIATVLFLTLSACGAKATPTPDVMATANAAASTMIAETQAAMPTDTPIPPTDTPTDTPEPSPTIPPIPSPQVFASPTTAVSSNSGGACNGPIQRSKGDTAADFLINNKTSQLVTISLQLKKNAFGDCGYWSTVLSSHGSYQQTSLPLGCYNVYSFNQTGKPDFQNGYWNLCTGFNTDKFTINLTTTTIQVIAP